MGTETKTRKNRATHQVVTVLLVFLMGVALGWVLRGGPRAKLDEGPPLEVARTAPEADVSEPPVDEIAVPGEIPEPAEMAAPDEAPAPGDGEEHAGALEMFEDVWPARHLIIAISGTTLSDETTSLLSEIKPGGVVLSKNNIENRKQTENLVAGIKAAVGLGTEVYDLPVIAVGQEGGVVNPLNLESAPGAPELGAKRDVAAAREAGFQFGQSCRERGIGILLAPVLDVVLPGAPEVIKARSFGKDLDVVQSLGLAFADGAMQGGVAPIVKHYPGHGAAQKSPDNPVAVIELEQSKDLARILYPFAQAVVAGVPGMMVGHIAVPHLDAEHPRRPASLSPVMVHEYLRNRWSFNGVIVSDDIAGAAAATEGEIEKAAVQALAAGCDALLLEDASHERIRGVCAAIEAAVADGVLSLDTLNDSKRRLDGLQAWLKKPAGLQGEIPKLETETSAPAQAKAEDDMSTQPAGEEKPAADEAAAEETGPKPAEAAVEAPKTVEEAAAVKPEEPEPAEAVAETAPEAPKPAAEAPQPAAATDKPVYHLVKPGDTLTRLSLRYNVSIEDLKAWNDLDDEKILLDTKLRVSPPGN